MTPTFFQMGTVLFSSLMAKSTAFNDSDLCGEETAIKTLISPIGHVPSLCTITIRVTSQLSLIL